MTAARVRLEDLPAALRDRIRGMAVHDEECDLGVDCSCGVAAKKNRSVAKVARGSTTWRCHPCGFTTTVHKHIEDHCHETGHVRYEIVLP